MLVGDPTVRIDHEGLRQTVHAPVDRDPAGPVSASGRRVIPPDSDRNPSPETVPSTSVASCRKPATNALVGAASNPTPSEPDDAATEHPPRRLLLQDLPQLPPAAASAVSLLLDLRRRIWPYFRDDALGAGTGGLFAADRQLNAYFSVLLNL